MKKIIALLFLFTSLNIGQVKYFFKSFSDFKFKLDSICNLQDETLRNNSINAFWDTLKAHGKIPFTHGDSVAFIYRGSASSVKWAGDFNGWNPNAINWEGKKVGAANDVWINIKSFPSKARLDYKLVINSSNWITDPSNLLLQYSGVGTYNSELRMPNWKFPDETLARPEVTKGNISQNFSISSTNLGYDVYYRVYTPANYHNLSALPVIYVTDGHEYTDDRLGSMINVLDKLIHYKKIKPIIAVFIDPRSSPSSGGQNRRGEQYVNNSKFANFVVEELVPKIDLEFKTNKSPEARAILGTSLGGLNSAYFGATKSNVFHLIGIHSPAFQAGTSIYNMYQNAEKLPLKIFMSTGTIYDTQSNALQMKSILDSKGYQLMYIEVPEGHSWGNWKALLDEPLIYFFKDEIQTGMIRNEELPTEFEIINYPNPFNPSTKIWFSIPTQSTVNLEIYNSIGEKVDTLISNSQIAPGKYNFEFHPKNYASEIYFARLQTESVSILGKMVFLK